jgi:hypothetical protein
MKLKERENRKPEQWNRLAKAEDFAVFFEIKMNQLIKKEA